MSNSGRLVATEFYSLPSKRALPDYYQITRMPIALDTVESKLKKKEFPNLSALESYLKRMCQNAKEYNQKGSQVSDDAERIRRAVSNFMVKNNPAYKVKGYVAQPTPFPEDEEDDEEEKSESEAEEEEPAPKKKGRATKIVLATSRSSATPVKENDRTSKGYEGLNLQQAQEKIIEDLLNEKEYPGYVPDSTSAAVPALTSSSDDYGAFADFVELPPRALKDYYRQVKNPMSLLSLQKRVKGNGKKLDAQVASEFKSWNHFEDEASHLWKNAYFYNEDGSEIFIRAQKLEVRPSCGRWSPCTNVHQKSFHKYLTKAKQAQPGPKIKLKLPDPPAAGPKITLKLGAKGSPTATPTPTTNGSNTVQNGTTRRNPFGASSNVSTPVPALDPIERAKSASVQAASPSPAIVASVKDEESARNSPAVLAPPNLPNGIRSTSQASSTPVPAGAAMLPPTTPGPGIHTTPAAATPIPNLVPPPPIPQINPQFESQWRQPGQGEHAFIRLNSLLIGNLAAMITNLNITTHPGLNISRHFRMDVPPSPTMTHQSVTINLPQTHYYIQIKPALVPSILERQHRMFITCGGTRLTALPLNPGHPIDPLHALYDCRIHPGVNRIEIELIAALPKGAKGVNGLDYELEKITVYANLMKA